MSELHVQHAAVALHQRKEVEPPFVAGIVQGTEMAPIDFEAIAWIRFHAHEGSGQGEYRPMVAHIFLQDRTTAGKPERPQSLCNDSGAGFRVLLQKFVDGAFENVEFAGAGPAHWFLNGRQQVLFNRSRIHTQMTCDAPQRPTRGMEIVNVVDLIGRHHVVSLLSANNAAGTIGLLFASAATGRDRSHQEGTVAEPFCMIRGAVGGDSHKPTYHWSFCQSPVASMVPGFVLMPLVTLSFPKGDGGDPV
jgi:hypothetical protein